MYHYTVYYTYSSKLSSDEIKNLQEVIFEFLDSHYGLEYTPTGYSHSIALGGETLQSCDGMTQDLEFTKYADVREFVKWLKDMDEICRINFHKWNEKIKEIEYTKIIKK